MRSVQLFKATLVAALLVLGSVSSAFASLYHVNVDTSSISGIAGAIEFQFNGDQLGSAGTAVITNFVGGTLGPILPPDIGLVGGSLPGPLTFTLDNANFFSDRANELTFASQISFDVAFSGIGTFAMSFWNSPTYTANLLVAPDPGIAGASLILDVTGGNATINAANDAVDAQAVPEPASLALWGGIGLAGLVAARRRRREAGK